MYKLKNLIGHISSKKSRARTKVSRIPLNFFSFIMLILTEMFCAAIFIAIYWSLCAYCEIISLLDRDKNVQKKPGNLCLMLVHYVALHIASRGCADCFMDLNTSTAVCDESGEEMQPEMGDFRWVRDV
jgi:hypothetical protein